MALAGWRRLCVGGCGELLRLQGLGSRAGAGGLIWAQCGTMPARLVGPRGAARLAPDPPAAPLGPCMRHASRRRLAHGLHLMMRVKPHAERCRGGGGGPCSGPSDAPPGLFPRAVARAMGCSVGTGLPHACMSRRRRPRRRHSVAVISSASHQLRTRSNGLLPLRSIPPACESPPPGWHSAQRSGFSAQNTGLPRCGAAVLHLQPPASSPHTPTMRASALLALALCAGAAYATYYPEECSAHDFTCLDNRWAAGSAIGRGGVPRRRGRQPSTCPKVWGTPAVSRPRSHPCASCCRTSSTWSRLFAVPGRGAQ